MQCLHMLINNNSNYHPFNPYCYISKLNSFFILPLIKRTIINGCLMFYCIWKKKNKNNFFYIYKEENQFYYIELIFEKKKKQNHITLLLKREREREREKEREGEGRGKTSWNKADHFKIFRENSPKYFIVNNFIVIRLKRQIFHIYINYILSEFFSLFLFSYLFNLIFRTIILLFYAFF